MQKLKAQSGSLRRPSSRADLEQAIDKASDARDIARDMLRRLPEYDGSEEESTARHDAPHSLHVHVHQDSRPDVEVDSAVEFGPVKVTGMPKWATAALVVAAAAATAGATAVVAHLLAGR